MNEFTLMIKRKGYTVEEFCEYWDNMSYKTYNRYCNDYKKHDKLRKMIEGMK